MALRAAAFSCLCLMIAAPAHAEPCAQALRPVYVGGVVGFDSLGDPAASAGLRATGRVGLYLHFNALPPALFTGRLAPVYRTFAATGPAVAELGWGFMNNPAFTGTQFRAFFSGLGETPWAALVNAPDNYVQSPTQTVAAWQAQAATARGLGIRLFVPVTAPNDYVGIDDDPAASPRFAPMRAIATAMGAVAIDAPGHYFLAANAEAPRYREWLVRWVRWAAAHDILVFWIVSPDVSGTAFLADTQAQIAFLQAHDALPHIWVVENYDGFTEVTGATVTAPGHGYTHAEATVSPPPVPWGVQAIANATVKDGQVTAVGIVDPGAGYLAADIAVTGDGSGAAARATVEPRQGGRPAGTAVAGDPAQPNPNVVGRDDLPESVAGVALWVARSAPSRPWPATLPGAPGVACQP